MLSNTNEADEYRKEFKQYYLENIQPKLNEFESLRQSKRKIQLTCIILCTITTCIAIYTLAQIISIQNATKGDASIFLYILLMFLGGVSIITSYGIHMLRKDFERTIRAAVIKPFLNFFGNFVCSSYSRIPEGDIKKSKLVDDFNSYSSDDYFEGQHDGLKIVISEVDLFRKSSNNGGVTVFKGIFVQIDMNKKFLTHTIIKSKDPFKKFWSFKNLFGPKTQIVKLEDPEFDKLVEVFAQDQTEARYLITTSFMERFKSLQETYKTKDIRASFLENKVTIAISCKKDMFRIGDLSKPVTDTGQIQELFEEFVAVLSLVDLLHLDSKTGL